MPRRLFPILLATLFLAASAGGANLRTVRLPLAPASLAGADIFTTAEAKIARAATAAGLAFAPDPRPLPPQIILTLDTVQASVQKRNELLLWRGDMLPDQLAPAETGTLIRKRGEPGGTWKTIHTRTAFALSSRTNLIAVARPAKNFTLPRMIIETPYQLGTLGTAPVVLVLWRTTQEDSAPLGGFIALQDPPAAFLDALPAHLPPFDAQAEWAAEFDALSP
jgi:hypothetical protein